MKHLTAARAAVAGLAAGIATTALLAAPAGSAQAAAPETTRVVLDVAGCEGCELAAQSYDDGDVWSSKPGTVTDGRVVLRVPTARTEGMSITVRAPWERHVGAVGNVVFRYAGQEPGDPVTPAIARAARKGSPCFPGIDAPRIALDVKVVRAHFPGQGGRATAPAAFTTVGQPTDGNNYRTYDGFSGSQDVVPCD
jgi:hypothetical protein